MGRLATGARARTGQYGNGVKRPGWAGKRLEETGRYSCWPLTMLAKRTKRYVFGDTVERPGQK